MKRAALVDLYLVAALLAGATALFGLVQGLPGSCPTPGSGRVEALFAPCLAAGSNDPGRSTELARRVFPPLPLQPGATVTIEPEQDGTAIDVDVTGSIGKR